MVQTSTETRDHTMSPTSTGNATRANEIRKDPIFNRWVLFSSARSKRPSDLKSSNPNVSSNSTTKTPACPFCIGRENECAPQIFRVPPEESVNWKIRVIENLYPALRRDLDTQEGGGGGEDVKDVVPGFGFHDVVIDTPFHGVRLSDLGRDDAGEVVLAYKERALQLKEIEVIKYIQVFKNYGASAGASMSHSHSQIMALPIIPTTVISRLESMKDRWTATGKCSLCEIRSEEILIDESSHFFSIVPFAASSPFEIWIVPWNHDSHFHEIDREKAMDFGGLLSLTLKKVSKQLNDPPFNFMIHTSPLDLVDSAQPYAHWFIQIVPQLSTPGGFEMGSGCYINSVFPEDAAKLMREVNIET